MNEQEELFQQIGESIANATAGHLFGKRCYKVKGKAFISFFEDDMVFKLEKTEVEKALLLPGSKLFDPSKKSRPMKEWVQIPFKNKHYLKQFAQSAFNYVEKLKK